ncbi:hypothetical protein N9S67_00565 [Candidatus Pelagibacter sp.]|nr:hypothetical protein [Candidatus Pelagibacter sp.]
MKTFRAFGPTIGKGKLSRKFINTINAKIDKSIITKKMIIALSLQAKSRMN